MEFLQANWIWLLLVLGAVWFFMRRGGLGCGMGGHESHGSRDTSEPNAARQQAGAPPNRHGGHGDPQKRETETARARRHHGC